MKAIITVEMDGALFNVDTIGEDAGASGFELARILRTLATEIQQEDFENGRGLHRTLRDINGNTVGSFKVMGRRG